MKVLTHTDAVSILTEGMRECDQQFETTGGSTRHYVRDLLLPWLTQRDICLTKIDKNDYETASTNGQKEGV
jgi:hypothetical protein